MSEMEKLELEIYRLADSIPNLDLRERLNAVARKIRALAMEQEI
jgi:hypothetical protein